MKRLLLLLAFCLPFAALSQGYQPFDPLEMDSAKIDSALYLPFLANPTDTMIMVILPGSSKAVKKKLSVAEGVHEGRVVMIVHDSIVVAKGVLRQDMNDTANALRIEWEQDIENTADSLRSEFPGITGVLNKNSTYTGDSVLTFKTETGEIQIGIFSGTFPHISGTGDQHNDFTLSTFGIGGSTFRRLTVDWLALDTLIGDNLVIQDQNMSTGTTGQVLTRGATPDAIVWATPDSGLTEQQVVGIVHDSLLNYPDRAELGDTAAAIRADFPDISGKLNISDTAAMLAPYATKTALEDTAAAIRASIPDGAANVLNCGTPNDSTPGAQVGVNACLQQHSAIYLPPGNYVFSDNVFVPSNRTIYIDGGANIILADGANSYIFQNEDFDNGNKNISIIGVNGRPNIYGNAAGQTRDYSSGVLDTSSYWGIGIATARVTDFRVENLIIHATNSWGIGHFYGLNHIYNNISFYQVPPTASNGDGITGIGTSSLFISNISGYTSDDMIAVASGGGSMAGNEMGLASVDIKDVHIRNIFSHKQYDTLVTLRAVRLTGRDSTGIDNVTIENVSGYYLTNAVDIANFWQATNPGFYTNNVRINNVTNDTAYNRDGVFNSLIRLAEGTHSSVVLDNCQLTSEANYKFLKVDGGVNTIVEDLSVDHCFLDFTSNPSNVFDIQSVVDNLYISNTAVKVNGANPIMARTTTADTTRVELSNFVLIGYTPGVNYLTSFANTTALNGYSLPADTAIVAPFEGARVTHYQNNINYVWSQGGWRRQVDDFRQYGIGSIRILPETNLNNYTAPGTYVTPASGLINSPDGAQTRFTVIVGGGPNAYLMQIAINSLTGVMYFRDAVTTNFKAWKRLDITNWNTAYNFSQNPTIRPNNISLPANSTNYTIDFGRLTFQRNGDNNFLHASAASAETSIGIDGFNVLVFNNTTKQLTYFDALQEGILYHNNYTLTNPRALTHKAYVDSKVDSVTGGGGGDLPPEIFRNNPAIVDTIDLGESERDYNSICYIDAGGAGEYVMVYLPNTSDPNPPQDGEQVTVIRIDNNGVGDAFIECLGTTNINQGTTSMTAGAQYVRVVFQYDAFHNTWYTNP